MGDIFEKFNDDYLKFDRVENKKSQRPDLHAFLLLDELFPGTSDIIGAACHDEIYLDVDPEGLSEENILELVRCGVRYSDDSLCMFV